MASNDLELALRIRAAFEGQQALTNLATSFVDINKRVETLQRGLLAVAGSTEEAAKSFDYIQETANKFGLSLLDLSDNYLKLTASAKGTSLEGEATREIFEAVSAAMSVLGGDTITTERAFRALGQIMSKGQVYAEELKGQLAEAIPGAIQIMSRSLNIGTQDLFKLMETGQLSAEVLLPFAQQLKNEYSGIAEGSTTFNQEMNRLRNTMTDVALEFEESSGAFSLLKSAIGGLADNGKAIADVINSFLVVAFARLSQITISMTAALVAQTKAWFVQQSTLKQSTAAAYAAAASQEFLAKAAVNRAAAELRAATAAVQMAEANLASARTAQAAALAAAQLQAAQERAAAATVAGAAANAKLAASSAAATAAQKAMAAAASVWSRAWSFLMGPGGLIVAGVAALAYFVNTAKDAKTSTDDLALSTEEYATKLQSLSDIQKAASTALLTNALDEQREAVADLANEIEYLEQQLASGKETIGGNILVGDFRLFIDIQNELAIKRGELADETERLTAIEEKMAVATQQSADTLDQSNQKTLEASQAIRDRIANLLSLTKVLADSEALLKRNVVQYEQEANTIRQSAELYALRSRQSAEYLRQRDAEIVSSQALVDASKKEMESDQQRLLVEKTRLELMKQRFAASDIGSTKISEEIAKQELLVTKIEGEISARQFSIDKYELEAATARGASRVLLDSLSEQQGAEKALRVEREITIEQVQSYQSAFLKAVEAQQQGVGTYLDLTEAQSAYNEILRQYETQEAKSASLLEARNKIDQDRLAIGVESLKAQADQAKANGDELLSIDLLIASKEQEILNGEQLIEMRNAERVSLERQLQATQLKVESDQVVLREEAAQLQSIKDLIAEKENQIASIENSITSRKSELLVIQELSNAQVEENNKLESATQYYSDLSDIKEKSVLISNELYQAIQNENQSLNDLLKVEGEVARATSDSLAIHSAYQASIGHSEKSARAYRDAVSGYSDELSQSKDALQQSIDTLTKEKNALDDVLSSLEERVSVERRIAQQLLIKSGFVGELNEAEQERLEQSLKTIDALNQEIDSVELYINQKELQIKNNELLIQSNSRLLESYRLLGVELPDVFVKTAAQSEAAFKEIEYQQKDLFGKLWQTISDVTQQVSDWSMEVGNYLTSPEPYLEKLKELFGGMEVPINTQREAFLSFAEAALLAAQATDKTIDPSIRAKAETLGLSTAYDELALSLQKPNIEFDALAKSLDRINERKRLFRETTLSGISAIEAESQAQVNASQLIGDYNRVIQDSIRLDEVRMEKLRQEAIAQRLSANEALEKVSKLEALEQANQKLSNEQKTQLEIARQESIQSSDSAAKAEALVQQLEAEGRTYDSLKGKIEAATKASLLDNDLRIESLQLSEGEIHARLNAIQEIDKLNVVRENEAKSIELTLESLNTSIELAQEEASKKIEAADRARTYVEELKAQKTATELLDPAVREEIANAELVAIQLEKQSRLSKALVKAKEAERVSIELAAKTVGLSVKEYLKVDAILSRLGLNTREVFLGVDAEFQRSIDSLEDIGVQANITSKDIKKAFTDVLSKADTKDEIEAVRQKLIELGQNGKLTGEQVDAGLLQIRQRAQEIAADPSFNAVQEALAKLREETARGIALGNQERESLQGRIQSSIELANARGKEAEAARLSALAAKEVVDQSNLSIQQLQRQKTEIDTHIQRIYAAANADGVYTDAERKVIEALQDQSTAIAQNIQRIEAKLPLQQREADQAERMSGSLGQLIRLYKEQSDEHQRNAEVSERYNDVRLKEIEGSIRVAEAQGDETEAARLKEEQQKALIEQADEIAANRSQEAADAENAVAAKTLELIADGELSAADRQQIADLQAVAEMKRAASIEAANHANALREEADAGRELPTIWEDANQRIQRMAESADQAVKDSAENAKAAGDTVSSFYNSAISALSNLGEGAVARFRQMRGEAVYTGDELGALAASIQQIEQNLANSRYGHDRFTAWLQQITVDSVEVQKAFLGQARAAESLAEQLESVGEGGKISGGALEAVIRRAQEATTGFKLLDQARLSRLEAAIESANTKLREMQEETQSAKDRLLELNADLLEAQGQDQKAELLRQQLEYQQSLAEIEAQRQDAKLSGNHDLIDILNQQQRVLEKINQTKVTQIVTQVDSDQATTQLDALTESATRAGTALQEVESVDLTSIQDSAEQEAAALQKIAEATQALNEEVAAADQERLMIEQEHLKELDALTKSSEEERQSLVKSYQEERLNEEQSYYQSLREQQQQQADAIEEAQRAHQDTLLELHQDYLADVANEETDLQTTLIETRKDSAQAVSDLYQDLSQELKDLSGELSKSLLDETNNLTSELLQKRQELEDDFNSTSFDLDVELGDSIEQAYADLAKTIADRQLETQQALADMDAEWLQNTQDSMDSLAEKSEDFRRKLLSAQGEKGQLLADDLGDELESLTDLYAKAGEGSNDAFATAVDQARELSELQLESLLEAGDLSNTQYHQAKQAIREQIAAVQELADQKRTAYEEELRLKKQLALEDEAQAIVDAQEQTAALKAELQAELVEKKAALQETYAFELEQAQQVIRQSSAERIQQLRIESSENEKALQEDAKLREREIQQELNQSLENLKTESAERLVLLAKEYEASKQLEIENQQQTIQQLQADSREAIDLLKKEFAEKQQLINEEQRLALKSLQETYAEEQKLLKEQTQEKINQATQEANQAIRLAAENVDAVRQEVAAELELASAKSSQTASQIQLNQSMRETLSLTNQIKEGLAGLSQSNLSGLIAQASQLNASLKAIDQVL